MAASTTPPDVKAAALADLLSGEQPAVVAERYGLDAGLVRVWKQRHVTEGATPVTAVTPRRLTTEEYQARILELVIANLETKLHATAAIAAHVQRAEWLEQQKPEDVALFYRLFDSSAASLLGRLAQPARADGEPEETN